MAKTRAQRKAERRAREAEERKRSDGGAAESRAQHDTQVPVSGDIAEIEAARLMTRWVATLTDEDPDRMLPREASMVKLFVTEVARKAALDGMQMMGGYGYASEYDMERLVRSTLVSTIYGGTSEIQRNIIAKTFGL